MSKLKTKMKQVKESMKEIAVRFANKCRELFSGLLKKLKAAGIKIKSFTGKVVRKLKSNRFLSKKWVWITGLVLLVVVLPLTVYGLTTYYQITDPQRILLENGFDYEEYYVDEEFSQHTVNIALLGFDRDSVREQHAWLFLPDVIAVISINFEDDTVKVVRVPRDSYVPIHNTRIKDKINHSYYIGYHQARGDEDPDEVALRCTLETVRNLMGGIPIHYYVSVDMDGVVQLVDAMGGVPYYVEYTIRAQKGRGRVLVEQGHQLLKGREYLAYIRDRSVGGDYGRITRQMNLLIATAVHFQEEGLFRQIPSVFRLYRNHIDTNLSYKQIAALALYLKDIKNIDEIVETFMFTGQSASIDGIFYLALNQTERVRIIKEAFGITATLWPTDVLRDTPPPAPQEFYYAIVVDENEKPAVYLSWVPGEHSTIKDENLRYHLYRVYTDEEGGIIEAKLAEDLEETEFYDFELRRGVTYTYTLVVQHFREEGPPVSVSARVPFPLVEVPTVYNLSEAQARAALAEVGLYVAEDIEYRPHREVLGGNAIGTEPAAGTQVEKYSTVVLVLSNGNTLVPDVVGMTEAEAKDAIIAAGLVPDVKEAEDAGMGSGIVITQHPEKGTIMARGGQVVIHIYKDPE